MDDNLLDTAAKIDMHVRQHNLLANPREKMGRNSIK